MIIREARDADWEDIYPIFRSIVDEGTTYAFPDGLSLEDARPWWMERPPGLTVVALEEHVVIGSAKMGPNRPGRGSHVATASFMVSPTHQGRGVGFALGHYVIDWARAAGYRSIQFNAVVETNVAAVRLWEKLGFSILATVPQAFDHPEDGLVGLHLMFMEL
jgi:L-amino acid N-acyltransferase YncA